MVYWLGTAEERGLIKWAEQMELTTKTDVESNREDKPSDTYDFPIGMETLKR